MENMGTLLPQFLFATYDISLFFVTSPIKNTDIGQSIWIPLAVTFISIGIALVYGYKRKDLLETYQPARSIDDV